MYCSPAEGALPHLEAAGCETKSGPRWCSNCCPSQTSTDPSQVFPGVGSLGHPAGSLCREKAWGEVLPEVHVENISHLTSPLPQRASVAPAGSWALLPSLHGRQHVLVTPLFGQQSSLNKTIAFLQVLLSPFHFFTLIFPLSFPPSTFSFFSCTECRKTSLNKQSNN